MGKKNLVLYVFDNLAGTVDASAFISVHLKDLVGSFQSEGRPLDELFEHMTAEDFAGKYDEIVLLVPENYDPIRVFWGRKTYSAAPRIWCNGRWSRTMSFCPRH